MRIDRVRDLSSRRISNFPGLVAIAASQPSRSLVITSCDDLPERKTGLEERLRLRRARGAEEIHDLAVEAADAQGHGTQDRRRARRPPRARLQAVSHSGAAHP